MKTKLLILLVSTFFIKLQVDFAHADSHVVSTGPDGKPVDTLTFDEGLSFGPEETPAEDHSPGFDHRPFDHGIMDSNPSPQTNAAAIAAHEEAKRERERQKRLERERLERERKRRIAKEKAKLKKSFRKKQDHKNDRRQRLLIDEIERVERLVLEEDAQIITDSTGFFTKVEKVVKEEKREYTYLSFTVKDKKAAGELNFIRDIININLVKLNLIGAAFAVAFYPTATVAAFLGKFVEGIAVGMVVDEFLGGSLDESLSNEIVRKPHERLRAGDKISIITQRAIRANGKKSPYKITRKIITRLNNKRERFVVEDTGIYVD